MLQIYEKRADNVVQKRVFLIFLGLLLMQTLAFAQSDSKITIQQKDITVVDALKTVERQSKMSINYSDSELKGKKIADLNLEDVSYNRQIKKFPTEKQNVSLKHILT